MIDLDAYKIQERRSIALESDALVDYTYDEVIESLRPGISWKLVSLERCCEDHVELEFVQLGD